jgi:hypothetical protein
LVTLAISLKIFFIECLFNSLCQIRSFFMVTQSVFLQCADTKRESNSFSHQLHFSGCSAIAMNSRSFNIITDLIYHACNKVSVRVMFLFVFPQLPFVQLPSSSTYHITSFWKTYSSLLIILFIDHFFVIDPTEAVMEESMDTIFYLRGS